MPKLYREQWSGLVNLTTSLSQLTGASTPETIGVILETTSGPLVEYFHTYGFTVRAINPNRALRPVLRE